MASAENSNYLPAQVREAFLPSVSLAEVVVATLSDREFELLLRAVDLVLLSQAFIEDAFMVAVGVPRATAERLTDLLVRLGVLSSDQERGTRLVLVDMLHLPVVLLRLNEGRLAWRSAA